MPRSAPGRLAGGLPDEGPGPGKTETLPQPETRGRTQLDRPWKVIVWDDPVNLMSYVVYVFQRLFGFSAEVANTKMMEVHEEGRSVVATEARERAEFFVSRLHAYGLQATLERAED
jgi:ATP-dependent Clp protease adaptor protein ClpS